MKNNNLVLNASKTIDLNILPYLQKVILLLTFPLTTSLFNRHQ